MEDQNVLDRDYLEEENLRITDQIKLNLRATAKWAKFLAIVGFVNIGLLVLIAIWMLSMASSLPTDDMFPQAGVFDGIFHYIAYFYLIICIILFFPTLYLYRFSTNTLKSLDNDAQFDFEAGIANLKSFFKFIGVMTAISLGLYAFLLLIGGLAAMAGL